MIKLYLKEQKEKTKGSKIISIYKQTETITRSMKFCTPFY